MRFLPVLIMLGILAAIDESPLDVRIAGVLPRAEEEIWRAIPWRTDLLGAREEAWRESKPMFLWIMNGHPLGCT